MGFPPLLRTSQLYWACITVAVTGCLYSLPGKAALIQLPLLSVIPPSTMTEIQPKWLPTSRSPQLKAPLYVAVCLTPAALAVTTFKPAASFDRITPSATVPSLTVLKLMLGLPHSPRTGLETSQRSGPVKAPLKSAPGLKYLSA